MSSAMLCCDNYNVCHSAVMARATVQETEVVARARGWHIFHGETIGGREHHAVLCALCVGNQKTVRPPQVLPGQEELDISM